MFEILLQFMLLVLLFVRLDCEVYRNRPEIKSSDGDLILNPAYDKNIYLQPNGPQSIIFVGQVNLLQSNLFNKPIDHRSLNNYQTVTNAPSDILHRLERLDGLVASLQHNYTNILSRAVNQLAKRVSGLQILAYSHRDECQSQQCQHGGTCLNLINGYNCLCPLNWEGKNCEIDVNECRNFAGTDLGCQNGATCVNTPGSYECLCGSEWFGLHCTRKAKDCQQGDFEMCGHGTCIETEVGEGIKCICDQGWSNNGSELACLTDVNECDTSFGPHCSINPKVDCINLPGSFRCGRCPAGYNGDGFACYDIDECLTIPNGGCSTSPMVTCHNTVGSRICGPCPPSFEGDGVTCTWRRLCSVNNGRCHPLARCVDNTRLRLLPTAQCICPDGMFGNGIGIHGCYIPIGSNITQGCEGNPCGPNGYCHLLRSGYTCICSKGYKGEHCDNNVNICSSNPCLNGGTCRQDIITETGFRCECTASFSGLVCQEQSNLCGGVLDADEGSIVYPASNSTYDQKVRCAWVIHTTPDKVINVTFSKFNLEEKIDCLYNFLQIHDGRSSASQLIGRFCGDTYPKGGRILSSQNYLYLWFRSDRSVAKEGFALHWTSVKPECGGKIDATTHGYISSPGWPGKYPPNRDCYWVLTTNLGKRIQLHFFAFDIESYANCTCDYVDIYDREYSKDNLLNKFCNSTQPAPLLSSSSEILVHFHSDEHGSGNGFQIAFSSADGVPGCGGYYTAEEGEILSPSYNDQYLNNLNCEYKIKTGPDTKISIEFIYFQLENSFTCKYDYLKIYDGPNASESRLVGKYCGNVIPPSYISSSNNLFLEFKTDRTMSFDGFKIVYKSVCHFTILGDSGILKSPGYPLSYPNNKMCEFVIKTTPGRSIILTFQDFDIEDNINYNCLFDYVEIRDGFDKNDTLLGKFCGGLKRMPPIQTSSLNYMYIKFKTDEDVTGTGFYANYTTVDIRCGGIHREISGTINYPAEVEKYNNDESCTWILVVPEGMHIMITWNRFELEDTLDCISDYVELIEIDLDMTNSTIGKYCGSSIPPSISVLGNRLLIEFVSDSSVNSAGFSLSYTYLDQNTHCDRYFVKTHGYLYSPGWPRSYEPNRDCIWKISVRIGQQIQLNITNFDLEPKTYDKCDLGDYLEIRDGVSNTSTLIGKFCGRIQQKQIISTANSIYLHFHSDSYFSGKGFQIEWDSTITGCGGILTSYKGSISSPNYPQNYNENAECFYKIITSSGSRIRITFSDLQLEFFPNCYTDYVEIFDGKYTNSPTLGKFCQMRPDLFLETTSNYAFIEFRSDSSKNVKGFLINYETICNNNVSGDYGIIESPSFPSEYPSNSNCLWTVIVSKGSKINVTFTHFDVHSTSLESFNRPGTRMQVDSEYYCNTDYVQTREDLNSNFTNRYCGTVIPLQVHTKSNIFQIKFVSGRKFPRTGFRLEWIKYGCGGHIRKPSGTLTIDRIFYSPGEFVCEWLIESREGSRILLSVTEILMTESSNCSVDSLEIYNGQSDSSPLITKTCHTGITVASSTANIMFVKFVKKSSLRDVYFISKFNSSSTSDCGGKIESRSGLIHSKNYPKNYDDDLDCIWFITVPVNHRIELNIIDLDLSTLTEYDLADDDNCDDYINIYDDGNVIQSNYTYHICPQSNITQIITKSNNLAVQFITNSYGNAKGFKINFTMTCGAIIFAHYDGVIKNDDYVSYNTKNCTWTILAPTLDKKIKLTITHMSIPQTIVSNKRCVTSFLKVFDGNDCTAPLIGEYCGNLIPPMLVSRGNAITIQFGTYTDIIDGVFSAYYSSLTSACGGILTSEEGNIASPNYPLSYSISTDCEWTISTSPGNRVYITFEDLDIEYSNSCNEDYLEVRENNGGGRLLGVYCGNSIPTNTTAATKLYVKFHSDSNNYGKGFLARYGFMHGNDITDLESGVITSPLYPHLYKKSGKYTWRIITNEFGIITFNIDHVEIRQQNYLCNSYLAIYDGYNNEAPILDKICQILKDNLDTKVIKTTSNIAYMELVLDADNRGSLFHLQWTKSYLIIESEDFLDNCGSNHTEVISPGNATTFSSPGYPRSDKSNLNCEWVFSSVQGRRLLLIFQDISIESTPGCYAGSLSVYSSNNLIQWSPMKEQFCKEIQNYTFTASHLKVTFKTDSTTSHKAFQAFVISRCGGSIIGKSGTISPTWLDMKNNYIRSERCDWVIKVKPGRNIILQFDHFNITNTENACTTYIVLRNGESKEAPLLAKYCGYAYENRNKIITSSNSVFITYVTSLHFEQSFRNFILHYEEKTYECGVTSKLDSFHKWETISTPNYPSSPYAYTECVWVFSGPPGEILRIDFIGLFDLQKDDTCSQEVVEIRDGSSESSPLIDRYCTDKPGTIKTSNNYVYIKYITQLAQPRDGFIANISIDTCGGTIFADSGELRYPGLPKVNLPYGTVCEWHVISNSQREIQLQFKDVNIPESDSHCATKIEVIEPIPANKTVTVLKTLCHSSKNVDISPFVTSLNEVIIKLYIDKSSLYYTTSKDIVFRLEFISSRTLCGDVITTPEGYLTTPGYPHEITTSYCYWIIAVPNEKRRVRLEIIDISVDKQTVSTYNDIYLVNLIKSIPDGDNNNISLCIESTENKMSITIITKPIGVLHRFKAKFSSNDEILCGGQLTGFNGYLKSPDLDRPYTCEWNLNSYVGNSEYFNNSMQYNTLYINIRINSSSTSQNICRFVQSIVSIMTKALKDGPTFSRNICTNNTNVSYTIPFNTLKITARSNANYPFEFYLKWLRQPCGGVVHVSQDITDIFNVPVNYTDFIDCSWILIKSTEVRLEIKLEGSFTLNCADEYLQISEGFNEFAIIIGDYCRDRMPKNPLSTSFMYTNIVYHSKAPNGTKIKILATTSSDQCGGIITTNDRVFTSPNYPKGYSNKLECIWEIQTDVGNRISLSFIDRFAIENTINCSKDALIIYDWKNYEFIEMDRICGRHIPGTYNSTANKMKVTLHTDDNISLDGFKAKWQTICGGQFIASDQKQFIFSPGYPYEYEPNLDCVYEISGPEKISVKFEEFDLEDTYSECSFDNVTITGQKEQNYIYEVFCGKEMPKPMYYFDNVKVLFKTDLFFHFKGFKLSYYTSHCGGIINEPTLITSDNIDLYENMICTWIIEAPINKIVIFKILYLEMESSRTCHNGYVAISDGDKSDSRFDSRKRLALMCGYVNSIKTIKSNGNKAFLHFVSYAIPNHKSFKIEVFFSYSESMGCGGRVNLTSTQIIRSPLFGTNLLDESFLDCHWEVTTSVDHIIEVKFQSFHVAPCKNINQTTSGFSNCECDFVELRDGLNPNSFLIGKYCGHVIPPRLTSSHNLLNIRLSTDGKTNTSGFEVLLTVKPSICGQTTFPVSYDVTRWTSPGFETGLIPRGLHCYYNLDNRLDPSAIVQVTVRNLDIEGSYKGNCEKDKLVIASSSKPHDATLGRRFIMNEYKDFFTHAFAYAETVQLPTRFELCNPIRNVDFYVHGGIGITLLTSPDSSIKNHKGVEIEISYSGYCGRNYSGTYGRIETSYDYRGVEGRHRDCYTLITAPENHTISVYFMNVVSEYSDNEVFFEVYDGNKTDANLLLRITNDYTFTPIFSTTRHLLLHNHGYGDNAVTYDLIYVTTDSGQGCGGIIYNIVGKITSPLYPEAYRRKRTCQWDLTTPEDTRLMLRFIIFDLGGYCNQNYVELQDRSGNTLSRFCEEMPADFTSTDNFIRILFHTNMNNAGTGWVADFVGII